MTKITQNKLQRQQTLKGLEQPNRLQRQQTLKGLELQQQQQLFNEGLIKMENDLSIDEYSGHEYAKKQQSLIGKQLDEIQIREYQQQHAYQTDENMLKLAKRQNDAEKQLQKNHRKLYNIALKVKKSNQLEDEYKDITVFQKSIGYSLPIMHDLKYFDSNSGKYKYLHGRSSIKEQVNPEPNDYYQMFDVSRRSSNLSNQEI